MSQHDEPTTTITSSAAAAMQWMAHDANIKIKSEPMHNASTIDMAAFIMAQQQINHQHQQQQNTTVASSSSFYPDAQMAGNNQAMMSPPHPFMHQHFGQTNQHHQPQHHHQHQHHQEPQTNGYMPAMFNPLTPPGYSNAVMLAAVHQKLQEHQQQQQQQQLLQLHQQQHQHQQHNHQQQQQQQPLPAHAHAGHQSPTEYMQRQSTPFQSIARMPRADSNVSPIPLILTPNITPPIIADESSPGDGTPNNGSANDTAHTPPPAPQMLPSPSDKPSGTSATIDPAARMCSSPVSDTSKTSNAYEESIYKPRYNAKGDAKQCKCKQCDYVTIVKAELWLHSVQHMNPDKILRCAQCPFVTEYKHHLDFHRRNHTGDKPFQCKLCKYACVNNSMLKSHMKSHSDVHQYKCADCPYTSKYCHSMKLHLRNKLHKPALELGDDGLPKTGAFIDVYGSRRGPKARSTGAIEASGVMVGNGPKKVRRTKVKREAEAPGMHQLTEQQQSYVRQCLHAKQMQQMKEEIHHEDEQEQTMRHMLLLLAKLNAQNQGFVGMPTVSDEAGEMSVDESGSEEEEEEMGDNGLDLSVPHGGADTKVMAPPAATSSDTPRLSTSHRRKGRAFKLSSMQEPEVIEANGACVDRLQPPMLAHHEHSCKNENSWPAQPELSMPTSSTGPAWSRPGSADIAKAAVATAPSQSPPPPVYVVECRPCGIQFSDRVIHRLHMGYHGFNDPFTCNVCGSKCSDRVMFNMHIASQAH